MSVFQSTRKPSIINKECLICKTNIIHLSKSSTLITRWINLTPCPTQSGWLGASSISLCRTSHDFRSNSAPGIVAILFNGGCGVGEGGWMKGIPTRSHSCTHTHIHNIKKSSDKMITVGTTSSFFKLRHLFRFIHNNKLLFTEMLPSNCHELIKRIKSNNLDKIAEKNISTLTSIKLSCIGLLAFQCQLILNMILSQLTKRFLLTWWRLLWKKQKPVDLTKYL